MANVVPLLRVVQPEIEAPVSDPWTRAELVGRLVEISGLGASSALTMVFGLVVAAQQEGEPVAWVNASKSTFYPPDAAAGGVDLESLVVIRANDGVVAATAADKLLRSGAFGVVVLDLERSFDISLGLQARLVKLAQKHEAAVVCLTSKKAHVPSLSSLVSLRCSAVRKPKQKSGTSGRSRFEPGTFEAGFDCEVSVIKDKRRGPGWRHEEHHRGPPGLR